MTSGTPSCSTLAVTHISAMPPGAVPSTSVAGCSPAAHASATPNAADSAIDSTTVSATAPTKRCAPRRKSGWKREPSAQPSRHCPAFDTSGGSVDRSIWAAVSGIATASEPSTNAFGRLSHWQTALPASVAAISSAKPPALNAFAPCTYGSVPWMPSAVIAPGTIATTIRMRRLCAAAMRSMRPPKRSPSVAISAAPPGTLAKIPVVRSRCARRASATPEM